MQLGGSKVTPYVMGEFGHWGQDIQLQDYNRLWGQVGLRASIPFWSVNPNVESELLNVHGVAHKIVLDADLSAADANQRVTNLPLYDQLDDNAQEDFRRRFAFNTFGGMNATPLQFDERLYALRGTAKLRDRPLIGNRRSPGRFSLRSAAAMANQTRPGRSPPNYRLDHARHQRHGLPQRQPRRLRCARRLGELQFPLARGRSTVGHFERHVRLLHRRRKNLHARRNLSRPPRGSLYAGFYALQGLNDTLANYSPFPSYTFNTYYSYRLSPKWVSSAGASINLSGLGLVGNQLTLTRVGESFLTSFNFVYNKYLNNVGFNFMIEPRFVGRTRTGNVGGAMIPLAGVSGLE